MCALKVLSLIGTNPKKGLKHKRVLQRDAFEGETYYEAIPTTAILTTLVLSTFFASIFQLDSDNENDSPLEFFLLACVNLLNLLGKLYTTLYCSVVFIASLQKGGVSLPNSQVLFMCLLAPFSPGLIIALVSTGHSKMFKTFLKYPSFFIVPVFTTVTFASSKMTCCKREGEEDGHIRFSVNASICNALASTAVPSIFV